MCVFRIASVCRTPFRVFDGHVSVEDCLVLNEPGMDEYYPSILLEGKSQMLLVGTAHVPDESRTGHLPSTSLGHHRYAR